MNFHDLEKALPEYIEFNNFERREYFFKFLSFPPFKKYYPLFWSPGSCSACYNDCKNENIEMVSFISQNRKLRVFDLVFHKDAQNILEGIQYCEFGRNNLYRNMYYGLHEDENDGTSRISWTIKDYLH